MSIDLVAGIDTIAATLADLTFLDNPLRVATRLEDVQPPCVWVATESVDHYLDGGEQLFRLYLVSGDVDEYRALKTLSPMLDAILGVLSPAEVTTLVTVQITTQQRPLPALRFTTTLTI